MEIEGYEFIGMQKQQQILSVVNEAQYSKNIDHKSKSPCAISLPERPLYTGVRSFQF